MCRCIEEMIKYGYALSGRGECSAEDRQFVVDTYNFVQEAWNRDEANIPCPESLKIIITKSPETFLSPFLADYMRTSYLDDSVLAELDNAAFLSFMVSGGGGLNSDGAYLLCSHIKTITSVFDDIESFFTTECTPENNSCFGLVELADKEAVDVRDLDVMRKLFISKGVYISSLNAIDHMLDQMHAVAENIRCTQWMDSFVTYVTDKANHCNGVVKEYINL